jgi:DNA end-binding protein Ku
MSRMIWKGAISFGLVHVPVGLYPASQDSGIDFDWLDKRSMDPVGYKRVNKRTGKEIDKDDIVKGIKQKDGDYVVLSDDEIRAAYPKTTQTIEIETFVKEGEIPFVYLDRPYYLEPLGKSDHVYALLREAMLADGVTGVARVVMHTKEHLAALIATKDALILNTMRWSADVRDVKDLSLPAAGKAGVKDAELKMARSLIDNMTTPWKPADYDARFESAIHALVAQRVKAGKTAAVEPLEDAPQASNVIDLTALLKQSLAGRKGPAKAAAQTAVAKKASVKPTAAKKRAPARKAA